MGRILALLRVLGRLRLMNDVFMLMYSDDETKQKYSIYFSQLNHSKKGI